jgi:hypothetical protein
MPAGGRWTIRFAQRYPYSESNRSGIDMASIQKLLLRTSDLTEVVAAVSRVYCPHEMKIRGSSPGAITTLEIIHDGLQAVVDLKYSIPVRVDAGDFRHLMLMAHWSSIRSTTATGSLADQLWRIYAKTYVPSLRNAGRTGTSQLQNSKRRGSKAAKNSSIPTAKRTSKLLVSRTKRATRATVERA